MTEFSLNYFNRKDAKASSRKEFKFCVLATWRLK